MIAALGLFVGLILGLTGAGGAVIAVPLLIFALNWDVARSAPVALLAVASSAALGAGFGFREGCVSLRAAAIVAIAGALATPLGLMLARRLPVAPLTLLFALVLLYVAWRMYRQSRQLPGAPLAATAARSLIVWNARCVRSLALSGLMTGLLSGLLGIGGGLVIVPALRYFTNLPMNCVIATSLTVVATVSAAAVAQAALSGHLDLAVAVPFTAGALCGMTLARLAAPKIDGGNLQAGFAYFAALVAIGLIVRAFLGTHV